MRALTKETGSYVSEKINSEYKRCASVVDAVVQMISYNEPVDCIPNVSNIKQEGPGRPKGKKKKGGPAAREGGSEAVC